MNFYKKINTYILERFPTLWNTHFVWLILAGTITHLLFFGFGYATLSFEEMKSYGLSNLFFRGSYFGFYLIVCLIAFIFFAFRYFAHNPFRNFYPISKLYFWKILGQLFIIFMLFGSVIISFENGMILKGKSIVPLTTVQQEIEKVNISFPFLFNDIQEYHIEKRSYPKPFPLDEISDFVVGYDSINEINILHGIDYSKPFVTLNKNQYQFGQLENQKIDSCFEKEYIKSIDDVSNVYGLAEYSIYNFDNTFINDVINKRYDYENTVSSIHKLMLEKDKNAIENHLQNLANICKKYDISYELNPSKMATTILNQNLDSQQLISTGFYDYKEQNHSNNSNISSAVEAESAAATVEDEYHSYKNGINYNYSVDLQKFARIAENTTSLNEELGYHQFSNNVLWFLIIASFFASLFLVAVKYIELKELLIGAVIVGILGTILSLCIYFLVEKNYSTNHEINSMIIAIFYAIIIIVVGVVGLYSKNIKKSNLTKWFLAMSISILCVLPTILLLIRELSKYKKMIPCEINASTEYYFDFGQWHFILLELIGTAIIFFLMRKIHSKTD